MTMMVLCSNGCLRRIDFVYRNTYPRRSLGNGRSLCRRASISIGTYIRHLRKLHGLYMCPSFGYSGTLSPQIRTTRRSSKQHPYRSSIHRKLVQTLVLYTRLVLKRPEEKKPVMEYSSPSSSFSKNYSLTLLRYLVISYTTPLYCSCYRLGRRDYAWSQIQGLHCGMYAGAWTNAMQSLWIAGQWMSHPSEHQEILELLERIEKESGWTTQWRADDLTEF